MLKIAIIGSSGMLGSALSKYFENRDVLVYEFNRSGVATVPGNECFKLEISELPCSFKNLKKIEVDYIVNCIGMIKQLININDKNSVKLAYRLNADFPHELNMFAKSQDIKVIQIGTDCVFSGTSGMYSENSPHDPVDIYGVTKNIGESSADSSMILRCSIIGKELETSNSLLSWVLSRKMYSEINGFTNHFWNGLSTLHFAKIVNGIIKNQIYENGVFHLVPADFLNKYELIKLITDKYGRNDLKINKFETLNPVNRILTTVKPGHNRSLWQASGYNEIPTIKQMVSDYAAWSK